MNYIEWKKTDDAIAERQAIEELMRRYKSERDEAAAIVWALAERLAPELLAKHTDGGEGSLVAELITNGADGAAELLLEGAMPCTN
jgi:hypothetical protein